MCRVATGSNHDLVTYDEPSFKITNELDLTYYNSQIDQTGRVALYIHNRANAAKNLDIVVDYRESYGSVLVENKIDHCENVLKDIKAKGFCTKMVMTFNKRVKDVEFRNVACPSEDSAEKFDWPDPFTLKGMDDAVDLEDHVYVVDFTEFGNGTLYPDTLDFMTVCPTAQDNSDGETLYMYVKAYGFPN